MRNDAETQTREERVQRMLNRGTQHSPQAYAATQHSPRGSDAGTQTATGQTQDAGNHQHTPEYHDMASGDHDLRVQQQEELSRQQRVAQQEHEREKLEETVAELRVRLLTLSMETPTSKDTPEAHSVKKRIATTLKNLRDVVGTLKMLKEGAKTLGAAASSSGLIEISI